MVPLPRARDIFLLPTDTFFRYRRDQYVIIHPRTDLHEGEMLAERLKHAIAELCRDSRVEKTFTATVSQANMPDDGDSVYALIVAAKRNADSEVSGKANHIDQSPKSIH